MYRPVRILTFQMLVQRVHLFQFKNQSMVYFLDPHPSKHSKPTNRTSIYSKP